MQRRVNLCLFLYKTESLELIANVQRNILFITNIAAYATMKTDYHHPFP